VRQQEKFDALARKKPDIPALPAFQDDAPTAEMLKQIEARAAHMEKLDVDVREWEKKHAKEAEADLRSLGAQIANELALSKVGQKICVAKVPDAGTWHPSATGAFSSATRQKPRFWARLGRNAADSRLTRPCSLAQHAQLR